MSTCNTNMDISWILTIVIISICSFFHHWFPSLNFAYLLPSFWYILRSMIEGGISKTPQNFANPSRPKGSIVYCENACTPNQNRTNFLTSVLCVVCVATWLFLFYTAVFTFKNDNTGENPFLTVLFSTMKIIHFAFFSNTIIIGLHCPPSMLRIECQIPLHYTMYYITLFHFRPHFLLSLIIIVYNCSFSSSVARETSLR